MHSLCGKCTEGSNLQNKCQIKFIYRNKIYRRKENVYTVRIADFILIWDYIKERRAITFPQG